MGSQSKGYYIIYRIINLSQHNNVGEGARANLSTPVRLILSVVGQRTIRILTIYSFDVFSRRLTGDLMSQIAGSVEMKPGSAVARNQNRSMTSKDSLTFHRPREWKQYARRSVPSLTAKDAKGASCPHHMFIEPNMPQGYYQLRTSR